MRVLIDCVGHLLFWKFHILEQKGDEMIIKFYSFGV